MNKEEFKKKWESNDNGGGITYDDVAEYAIQWGISDRPRTCNMSIVRYRVLKEANVSDFEDYNPVNIED